MEVDACAWRSRAGLRMPRSVLAYGRVRGNGRGGARDGSGTSGAAGASNEPVVCSWRRGRLRKEPTCSSTLRGGALEHTTWAFTCGSTEAKIAKAFAETGEAFEHDGTPTATFVKLEEREKRTRCGSVAKGCWRRKHETE